MFIPERVLKLVFLEPAWDRNSPQFKAMLDNFPVMETEYPAENGVYDNFDTR
jgi:hypothetical protein